MRKLLLTALSLAAIMACTEERPGSPDERAYKTARVLAEEGDLRRALPLLFKILRESASREFKGEARERLQSYGLSSQEIFQIEPGTMKIEEFDKLIARVSSNIATRRRQEMDMEYAQQLLQVCVSSRMRADGEMTLEVQSRELARALEMMLHLALSETSNDATREAQSLLEQLGIAGPKIEPLRRAIAGAELPPEIQNPLLINVCLRRLEHYREWLDDDDANGDKKAMARELGAALARYLQKNHPQAPQLKNASDLLGLFRDLSPVAPPRAEPNF